MKPARPTDAAHGASSCACAACAALPFARWQRNAMSRYLAAQPEAATARRALPRSRAKPVRDE